MLLLNTDPSRKLYLTICPVRLKPSMLRGALTNANGRPQTSPWVVFLAHKQYLDHHFEEQPLECELQAADGTSDKQFKMAKLSGLTTKWARKNNVESGVTTLFASNSVIDENSRELIIPTTETIKVRQTER